jgi:hypothetical protein
MRRKVDDEMRSLHGQMKDLAPAFARGTVTLRGRVDDCDDASRAADRFASIDGVDRIVVEVTCVTK